MKKITVWIVLLLVLAVGSAQAQKQGTLKLKNGIELQGTIVKTPGGNVEVTTADGDKFVYLAEEVRIVKEFLKPVERGYQQMIDFAGGGGVNMGGAMKLSYIGGYRFGHRFFLGAGIGFQLLSFVRYEYPVYAVYMGGPEDRKEYRHDDSYNGEVSSGGIFFAHAKVYLGKKSSRCQPTFSLSGGCVLDKKRSITIEKLYKYEYEEYNYGRDYSYSLAEYINKKKHMATGFLELAFGLNLRVNNKSSLYYNFGYQPQWTVGEKLAHGILVHMGVSF